MAVRAPADESGSPTAVMPAPAGATRVREPVHGRRRLASPDPPATDQPVGRTRRSGLFSGRGASRGHGHPRAGQGDRGRVPEIPRFYGIIIRMFAEPDAPHHRPHFHAYYQDSAAAFGIDPVEVIGGDLPRAQRRLVEAWAEIHHAELATDWQLLQAGRTPLRIARTAHAALRLLRKLRGDLGQAIPLAWSATDVTDHAVIEVYPAATLIAHGIPPSGRTPSGFRLPSYKKPDKIQQRREIVDALRKRMTIPERRAEALCGNDDLLDAAVCVLAAQDFLTGNAAPPPDRCLAEREGWIWTALPEGPFYTAPHE